RNDFRQKRVQGLVQVPVPKLKALQSPSFDRKFASHKHRSRNMEHDLYEHTMTLSPYHLQLRLYFTICVRYGLACILKKASSWSVQSMKRPAILNQIFQAPIFWAVTLGFASLNLCVAAGSFSDEDWFSMGGIPGVHGTVYASAVDT